MRTAIAGPDIHAHAGQHANVPEEQGEALIAGGYATRVDDAPIAAEIVGASPLARRRSKATAGPDETREATEAGETA